MEVPKNCRECQHDCTCRAWHYGSSRCKYTNEITRATIAQANNMKGDIDHEVFRKD